ncbi:MAG: riboflavin synthase [Candidatus Saganbacteria bacterium]|nr:riboflavin synthase [Candidatus Saganbacteria bacterium]
MFTGIIEELGIVTSIIRGSSAGKLTLSVSRNLAAAKVGDSIAVNGVCLTVANIRRNFLEFDLSSETMKRSTFSETKIGDKVNLERALPMTGRLGGHIVSGHVDGMGEIRKKLAKGKGFELYLSLPSELLRYLVPKGSITIDGISLTVADLRGGLALISLIPQTASATTLGWKNVGDRVNVEVDILSKYIERHLKGELSKGMTEEVLTKGGYLPMGWIEN